MIRQVIRDATGEVIAATCVTEPLTDEEQAALVEVAEAARRRFAERDADGALSARQALARERSRERLRRLRAGSTGRNKGGASMSAPSGSLTTAQADVVNDIRDDYYNDLCTGYDARARIMAVADVDLPVADWLLHCADVVAAGPIPAEAAR